MRRRRRDDLDELFDGNFDPGRTVAAPRKSAGGNLDPDPENDGMGGRLGAGVGGVVTPFRYEPAAPMAASQMSQTASGHGPVLAAGAPMMPGGKRGQTLPHGAAYGSGSANASASVLPYAGGPSNAPPPAPPSSGSRYSSDVVTAYSSPAPPMPMGVVNMNPGEWRGPSPGPSMGTGTGSSSGAYGGYGGYNTGTGSDDRSSSAGFAGAASIGFHVVNDGAAAAGAAASGAAIRSAKEREAEAEAQQLRQQQLLEQQRQQQQMQMHGVPGVPIPANMPGQVPGGQTPQQPYPAGQPYGPGAVAGSGVATPGSVQTPGSGPIVHTDGGRIVIPDSGREEIPPTYDSLPPDERR
ncbi:hypothetical protein AX16_008735 [Volvariella volvacea WC 439]|nr:hypothetical protein AX16_008735 [Volvariella volvacea WC 439]